MSELFEQHLTIKMIDISHNNIGDDGFSFIVDILSKSKVNLTKLNISHNKIESTSVIQIIRLIYTMDNLTELNLSFNDL